MLVTRDKSPVFPLALGGAGIGSDARTVFFGKPVSETQAVETVLYALSQGINFLDTSPFYGSSETRMGISIREFGNRHSCLLSTKAGTHPTFKGYTSDHFYRSIEASLKTLQTDYLDIVHIHDPNETDFQTVLSPLGGLEALLRLKEQGVIRYIGLGVRSHALHLAFLRSGHADVLLPYLDYNLLRTTAGDLLDEALKHKVSVWIGSPLCMGLLSGADPSTVNVSHYDIAQDVSLPTAIDMHRWCVGKGLDLQALNDQFILRHPGIEGIIIGSASTEEVAQNIASFSLKYPPEILEGFMHQFQINSCITH